MKGSVPNRARHRRESGQVMLLFVLLIVVLLLFVGLGIDLGFSYITQANLSKAVDAAALMGANSLSQGTNTAEAVARGAFALNYGTLNSGRDVEGSQNVIVQIFNDANGNQAMHVTATVKINTFFIRVLPQWSTLTVASDAEAARANVIMTLVLDTSQSMAQFRGPPPGGNGTGSGGGQYLPGAITTFLNNFDETHDQAAMVSFATIQQNAFYGGTLTQPKPTQPFKSPIITAVNNFNYDGYTFSQGGLTNALVMENNATIPVNESVVKIVVFCTDGRADVIQNTFNCPPVSLYNYGGEDVCPGRIHLFDPDTGVTLDTVDADCGTFPNVCTGATDFFSAKTGSMEKFCCDKVTAESQFRAIQVANQMRGNGIIVYSIGVGSGLTPDLGFLGFLQQVANDPNAPGYVATHYDGEAVVANDPSQLGVVFQEIASKILVRLTK